jgi:hypothetical protein
VFPDETVRLHASRGKQLKNPCTLPRGLTRDRGRVEDKSLRSLSVPMPSRPHPPLPMHRELIGGACQGGWIKVVEVFCGDGAGGKLLYLFLNQLDKV